MKEDGDTVGLVLSLFPGVGLLDMAFEEEGYCVVRGPDMLWGGDIRRFHPPAGRFDGLIGGPPCQSFSSLAHLVRANGHEPKFGNLIPEFVRCVREAGPQWFLMENVRQAPVPVVAGYEVHSFLWNNAWLPGEDGFGQEQERLRRFSFGSGGREPVDLRRWIRPAALMLMERARPVTAMHDHPDNVTSWSHKRRQKTVFGDGRPTRREARQARRRYSLADACRLQGLPDDFLADAPFTAAGKLRVVANGVPLPTGRAIAHAVRCAMRIGKNDDKSNAESRLFPAAERPAREQ